MSVARPHYKLSYEVKLTFLRHLRHLLRECTYLPDPAARKYFHNHILDRFRDYRPRADRDSILIPKQKWILDERHQVHCLQECRKKISFLHRASMGDVTALTRALCNTYGRSGRRRHELLRPYARPDVPKDSQEVGQVGDDTKSSLLDIPDAVKILGEAQTKQQDMRPTRQIGQFKKFTKPVLPERNSWGRKMPLKRIVNAKRRRYNELLDRILPPVTHDEWDRLRRLATGEIPFAGPPARRARLAGLPELPIIEDRHILTARFMRRLWGIIFLQTPTMAWDSVEGKWKIEWGKLDDIRPKSLEVRERDSYLFE
ncbi:MAG: hypothetical protein LQ340_002517 [Diploschistes diacapsis]|nr:MAG: hypothetical protein LQ340_002517 [Diploschistes diacapsis]